MGIVKKIARTAASTFVAAGGAFAAGIITSVGVRLLCGSYNKFRKDLDDIWPTGNINNKGGN